ncbi:light-regulated protein [Ananas comosus]|uniref:Light-regulated protein n=1 Tax=Ananas comosus TaxID=4615 RepID=A0A6P5F453_ANACO|nr:light-regulated protein [Ananas comosus]
MQATAVCSTGFILPFKGTNSSLPRTSFMQRKAFIPPRATMKTPPETPMVDYSSSTSVFPAEACETLGGEACSAEMFPEVKPATTTASIDSDRVGSEQVDREYFEYNEPKTVFPGEACDDLGGEFCEPEYQKGVHKETNI